MSTPNIGNERRYPEELRSREAILIAERRAKALGHTPDAEAATLPGDALGLALSGGGIRSATFCLGFLQVLAGHGVLRKIDVLSTVSGGGYCGSFLGRWFTRLAGGKATGPNFDDPIETLEREINTNDSAPLRWLRESGRYMSPTGPGDVWLTVAIYIRNLVSVQIVLGVALVAVFLAAWVIRALGGRLAGAAGWNAALHLFDPAPGAAIWWSPWILFPVLLFALVAVPLGWAYWLVPQSEGERGWGNRALRGALAVFALSLAGGIAILVKSRGPGSVAGLGIALLVLALLTSITLGIWSIVWGRLEDPKTKPSIPAARNRLASLLTNAFAATGIALAFALVDSLGQTFYAVASCQGWAATIFNLKTLPPIAAVLVIVGGIRKLSPLLERTPSQSGWKIPLELTLAVAAFVVAAVVCTGLSAATHTLVWAGEAPIGDPGSAIVRYDEGPGVMLSPEQHVAVTVGRSHPMHATAATQPLVVPIVAWLAALWLSFTFGRTFRFINLSSHHALYAARLTRAYLGATNPERQKDAWRSVREVQADDDVPFAAYRPHAAGGPLHVVNVTINETVAGDSQVEYRDRKGVPMAVGPAGLSVGARHHALWDGGAGEPPTRVRAVEPPFDGTGPRPFHPLRWNKDGPVPVEPRTLGEWIAISGAAFTTGLGYRTNLGASFLLGLSNIRLGYWWNSAIGATDRDTPGADKLAASASYRFSRAFPVQSYLLGELLGRFYGPARKHWYLSDGGHFENTACYELIRRRVPRILCCDCGADPDYQWEDVANLARKVRIDFNAELRIVRAGDADAEGLSIGEIGKSLEPPAEGTLPRVHAALARVFYMDDPDQRASFFERGSTWGTTILFVKPSLTGDEPLDVREYATAHPAFPQESTLDQDFGEAQWESYRKLGEHVGGAVIGAIERDEIWRQAWPGTSSS